MGFFLLFGSLDYWLFPARVDELSLYVNMSLVLQAAEQFTKLTNILHKQFHFCCPTDLTLFWQHCFPVPYKSYSCALTDQNL